MKISNKKNWQEIITLGIENQTLDYKSPMNWNNIGRNGRAKISKHAMAMANTQGGYIVIGVGEDDSSNPVNYQGLSQEDAASFDPSTVGQTINIYADPPIDFDIVKPIVDDKLFVIIVIHPFSSLPHVCTKNCESELRDGVFYIRTTDARSRIATNATEIHGLVQRALRNQRQLLGQMLRGILYEGNQLADPNIEITSGHLKEECRKHAKEELSNHKFSKQVLLEIVLQPNQLFAENKLSIGELKNALESLTQPAINEFPINTQLAEPFFASNNSIIRTSLDDADTQFYQEFFQNGICYTIVKIGDEQTKEIDFQEIMLILAKASLLFGQLYCMLNHADTILSFNINIINSQEAMIKNHIESIENSQCFINDIQITRQRSAADLHTGATPKLVTTILNEICDRFNIKRRDHLTKNIEKTIKELVENLH